MIIAKLTGQMNNMAKHKFASNVCEKALITADPDSRRQLIEEIMTPKQDGLSPIMGLMKDSFGSKSPLPSEVWALSHHVTHRLRPSEGTYRG